MPANSAELATAYYEILGIPPAEQPPNHYRLLGIQVFEANREVISNAAARQINYVRQHAIGMYANAVQEILNEVAAAKLCLLKEPKKDAYDAQLRAKLGGAGPDVRVPKSQPAKPSAIPEPPPREAPRLAETSKFQLAEPPSPVPPAVPAAPQAAQPTPATPATPAAPAAPAAAPPGKRPSTTVIELPPRPPTTAAPTGNATLQGLRRWLVGRDEACDVVVAREVVSLQHCRLEETADGFFLVDLDSTNGTYVNGTRVNGRVKVTPHDKITLGRHTPLPWPRSN